MPVSLMLKVLAIQDCVLFLFFQYFLPFWFLFPSYVVAVQLLSHVWLSVTPWTAVCQSSLSLTVSWSLLKCMSVESVMPSNHLILLSPSSLAFNFSQHQGLFQWVGSSHQVGGQSIGASASASVLAMNIQDWFPLGLTGLNSLLSKGPSRVFSNTTVQKHHFFDG